jgi:sugar O-acyltransferase (sialic acid O-acetyltransferase NeuD family)
MSNKKVVIIGASGHGKVIAEALQRQGELELLGFVDDNPDIRGPLSGVDILGPRSALFRLKEERGLAGVVLGIGANFVRASVAQELSSQHPDLFFATVVHPSAQIARDVVIGEGTVVMPGAVVNPGCRIGPHCIINTSASLDHDSELGAFASLAPGVRTGGGCRIGASSAIGIGAVLSHGVSIGDHTVIGAGSLVLQAIGAFKVAYGSPAKVVRSRETDTCYL